MNPDRGALQGTYSKKACFRLPVGGAPRQLPLGLRPAGVLPVGGAPAPLPVWLRPAGILPVGDAPPQLPLGLRPAGVLPVGGAPPCCRCQMAYCFLLVVRLFPREQGRVAVHPSNALWAPRARSRQLWRPSKPQSGPGG